MMPQNIAVNGITGLEEYPKYDIKQIYKEGIECFKLELCQKNPPIEFINSIKIDPYIVDYKAIKTIRGPKIIVCCELDTQVIYTADNCRQSLHMAECRHDFCNFINVNSISYGRCNSMIDNIFIGIQDVVVKAYDEYCADIAVVYLICPELPMRESMGDCYNNL